MTDSRSSDLLTISAVSVLAYILANVIHEGIGHGGACLLVGGVPRELTTAYFDWDSSMVSEGAIRFVAAGGTIANLLAALLFGAAFRSLTNASPLTRYFLWLTMSVNYFVAAGYPLFSGVLGIGDWIVVTKGLEPAVAWRIGLAVFGVSSYYGGVLLSLRMLGPFLGSESEQRVSRGIRLTVPPYLAGSAASTLGSLLNPMGAALVFTSAAAHFGGTSALAWMAQLLKGKPAPSSEGAGLAVGRSWGWLAVAMVVLILHIALLGPGI